MYGYEIAISEAFAEKLRLRIVMLLWESLVCVKCLTEAMGAHQSTISRHLAILRKSGIVRDERRGLHTYYYLDFEGEFGDLKKNLVQSYFEILKDRSPYVEDTQNLKSLHLNDNCNAECKIPSLSLAGTFKD